MIFANEEPRHGSDRRRRPAEEEDRPRDRAGPALLSVEELDERIALLKDEIARLEADTRKKQASRIGADQFFKK